MPRRGPSKAARAGNGKSLSDEMYDEIEQLHRSKTEDGVEGLQSGGSDDDVSVSEVEEEVMAQGGSDSDGAEEEEEERGAARWGRNKQAYYNTDDVSDEDDAELEEEEADRLQKRQLAGVGKEFFGGDSSDEEDDEEDGQRASGSGKTEDVPLGERRKAGAGGKASGPKSAPSLLDRLQQPLAAGAGDPEAERIDRAADKLSRKQRLSIVQRESPELISLLAQFKRSVAQLREQVQPVMQKVKEGTPTEQGISFLEVKFHLLLGYCTNVAFYVLLKARGASVQDHPVVDALVEYRAALEKTKPLDAKLRHQIDRLLRAADAPAGGSEGADPLRLKPDLQAMGASGSEEEEEEEEEEGGGEAEGSSRAFRASRVAPATVDDDDKSAVALAKKGKALRSRARRNRMLQEIREEVGDAPEEIREASEAEARYEKEQEERRRFEEDNFMRLMETKEDKRKAARHQHRHDRSDVLADLADFGDLQDVMERQDSLQEARGEEQRRRRTLAQYLDESERQVTKRGKRVRRAKEDVEAMPELDAEDWAAKREEVERKRRRKEEDHEERAAAKHARRRELKQAAAEADGADDGYAAVKKAKAARKAERKQRYVPKPLMPAPAAPDAEGPRAAGQKIVKNRGLMPSRSKLQRNPRLKKRVQYDKMVKARKGQVRDVRVGEGDRYGGEASGVQTHVRHSRRISQ